jgi:hypothetical protein
MLMARHNSSVNVLRVAKPIRCQGGQRRTLVHFLCLIHLWCINSLVATPLFERDILPLFTKHCLVCHGGLKQKGGLDMRTIPALLKGGESGAALKPGQIDASKLWKMIADDEMPKDGEKLSAEQKKLVQEWIIAGLPTVAQRQKSSHPLLPAGIKHAPAQVAEAIDQHLDRALASAKLKPAPPADDSEFLRRVYLDLTGRVPTAAQASAFLDNSSKTKRDTLIDALLNSPEFGEQFGRTWRDWVSPPELPSDPNTGKQPHKQTRDLGAWFGKRFTAGSSWDKTVREIVITEGDVIAKPQMIFFALTGEGGNATADGAARAVASLFMGVQLQCAQCHDDPYRTWSQKDYWALSAFFERTKADIRKISDEPVKAGDTKAGLITIPKTSFLNSGTEVRAAYLDGTTLQPKNGVGLRVSLADWLTSKDNPYFARAFANRTWFYLLGRGIVHPVDDMRDLNPPSHPGLLALLANEFVAASFDVKHVFRSICRSRAYQRTSRPPTGLDEAALVDLAESFGRMPLRMMTAETLHDSLKLAYGNPKLDLRAAGLGNTNGESAAVGDANLEFQRRFCTNEEDPTDFTHGVPQMLTMLNHPNLLSGSKALEDFLKTSPSPEKTVEWLYLSTLCRRPTPDELNDALSYIKKSSNPNAAYSGVLWMLVNRSEYLFIP